jgi:hypothetical protein
VTASLSSSFELTTPESGLIIGLGVMPTTYGGVEMVLFLCACALFVATGLAVAVALVASRPAADVRIQPSIAVPPAAGAPGRHEANAIVIDLFNPARSAARSRAMHASRHLV